MGKRLSLTNFEKGRILELKDQNMTVADISAKLELSWGVIGNYIQNPDKYCTAKRSGTPKKLSLRMKNAIIDFAKGKVITANAIKAELKLNVSSDTILRVLKQDGAMKRLKVKRKPVLKKRQKENRLAFANKYMDYGEKWKNVFFSDKKKFNLDGPDGYGYYWHALGSKSLLLSKRAMGGGSLMIWAAFHHDGRSEIAIIDENINSGIYQNVLTQNLIPYFNLSDSKIPVFQQDNARPHVSNSSKAWFKERRI